jgi:hypothetical protein
MPIGRPVANTRLYVLDKHLQPVPVGVHGELYVGGAGVGRGYLNAPGRTAGVFIPDPFGDEPGAVLYKTGDLVSYLPGGELRFLGRVDHQVKIRGFRIEPGEIETVLRGHPLIAEAVVLDHANEEGEKVLTAYVVARQRHARGAQDAASDDEQALVASKLLSRLRAFLAERLPEYMIPSMFVALESLPLTANGKIDRRTLLKLRAPQLAPAAPHVAARTPVEETVARIWQKVLGLPRVGVRDKFFDIGGDSLKIVRVFSLLNEAYPDVLTVVDLFKHSTVEEIAALLDGASRQAVPELQGFEL